MTRHRPIPSPVHPFTAAALAAGLVLIAGATSSPALAIEPPPALDACSATPSDAKYVLTGMIVDVQGGSVGGAHVVARCGSLQASTVTADDGRFSLELPRGKYEVRVEKAGFEIFTESAIVAADPQKPLRVLLKVAGLTDEVTVRSEIPSSPGTTKTAIPLSETPQAITVVPREMIQAQGAQNLQDALNYAAGVRSDAYGLDSRADSYSVRGGYPTEYLDGLRQQLGGYYTSTARTDPYQLERVEVLRGPSSMLFGQGSTGGVVNTVTKLPMAQTQREVGVQFGSFNRAQVQADFTGPVASNGHWLYRVVFLGRHADTQVDEVPDNRLLIAPSLTWRPSEATSLTLQFRGQRDRSGSTLQFQPWNGTVLPNPNGQIPTNQFLGEPGIDHYDTDRVEGGWQFQHRFSRWTLRQNARFGHNTVDYQAFYPDSYSNPDAPFLDDAQRVMNRYFWADHTRVHMATIDQQAETQFRTGGIEHDASVGMEFVHFGQKDRSAFDMPVDWGGGVTPIDVYTPVYTGYQPPSLTANPDVTQTQTGIYAQDQVKIASRLILVGGLRHDWANNAAEGSDDEKDQATSGRAGVMYRIGGGWSPYVSYSQSFTPTTGTDVYGNRYQPLRGEQVEAGLKYEAGRFYGSAAAYTLDERNRLIGDPQNPLNSIQVGETRTRGVELEALGHVLPSLDLSAHYNYLHLDEQLEGAPEHQVGIWGTYRFTLGGFTGLQAGLGLRYMSDFADGIAPTTPTLWLWDGMFAYDKGPWRYAINAQNLSDKTYVSTCLARGDCFYGARRTIGASLTRRF